MILQSTQSFGNYLEQNESYECRVCLQVITGVPQLYCECRGNHRNIHIKCLKEWAKRTPKHKDEGGRIYFFCDLCKSRIYLQLSRFCTCRTKQEISIECKEAISKLIVGFVLFVVFFIILLICISLLSQSSDKSVVLIVLAVFSSIAIIFSLPVLIIKLLLTCKYEIDGFQHLTRVIRNSQVTNASIAQ